MARPIVPGSVEFACFGVVLVAVVSRLVVLAGRTRECRDTACTAALLATGSALVLAKRLAHLPIQTYDMMLFATVCGWTTLLWLRRSGSASHVRAGAALRAGVWGAVAFLAVCQWWEQVRYLNDVALGYPDCGESARLMFNAMTNPRELFLSVNPDKPMFYDHVCPGVLPFLPLWLVYPDLKLTILLQLAAVFGVTAPLYVIGRRAFKDEAAALLLVLVWLVYPSTSQFVYSSSYGFRWGNLCLPLYFAALAFWLNGRQRWALTMAIWAILIKEEAAVVIGTFGLYLALFERRRTVGVTLATLAFGYFLLASSFLIPAVSGREYGMTRFFYDLGQTKWEILLSPLTRPRLFWGRLFDSTSFCFAAALLAPLLFLPLKKPQVLFVGSLTFVFCCLSPIMKNICFHYQAALLPVAFWALVRALQESDAPRRFSALLGATVTCSVFSLFLGAQPWSKDTLAVHRSPGRLPLVRRIGQPVQQNGSLFATRRIAACFIQQRYLYTDPPIRADIDYVFLDLQDLWQTAVNSGWLGRLRELQRQAEAIPDLHLIAAEDGLLLYSRRGPALDARHLVERDGLPQGIQRQTVELGCGVRIEDLFFTQVPSPKDRDSDIVRATTYSTVLGHTNTDLAVRCIARINTGTREAESYASLFKPLGQGIWPIARWETNKFYTDDFLITLPKGLAANVTSVSFEAAPLTKEGQGR